MKSFVSYRIVFKCILAVGMAFGVAQAAKAQSITLQYRFDSTTPGFNAASPNQLILTAGQAATTYTIDVFATIAGDATHTDTTKFGLKNIKYQGFSSITSGSGAFATGAGVGATTFTGFGAFTGTGTTAPKFADTGSTTDGSTVVTTPDGIVDFGKNLLLSNASQSIANYTFANASGEIEIAQFTFATGTASAGGVTKFFPTEPNTSQAANYTQDGSTPIIPAAFTVGTPLVFTVGAAAGGNNSVLAISPATATLNVLAGGTGKQTLTITNSGTDAGSYTSAFSANLGNASANPATSTVNNGTPVSDVISYTAAARAAGSQAATTDSFTYTITNSASGNTDTQAKGNKVTTFTANVGSATVNSDGTFNAANALTAVVAPSASYAGLSSQVVTPPTATGGARNGQDANGNGGFATILAGTNSSVTTPATVSMNWRLQTAADASGAKNNPNFAPSLRSPTTGLISNPVDLTGITPTGATVGSITPTDPYTLELSYNTSLLPKHGQANAAAVEAGLITNKLIYLVSFNSLLNGGLGQWEPATTENTGNKATAAQQGVNTSFASFVTTTFGAGRTPGSLTASELNSIMGAYGVDTTTSSHEVWAVLNHNSQFAVIPEPSSILLAGLGLVGLVAAGRRGKKKSA